MNKVNRLKDFIENVASGPQVLAFVPAIILAGYWLAGEQAMIALAVGMPATIVLLNILGATAAGAKKSRKHSDEPVLLATAIDAIDMAYQAPEELGKAPAVVAWEIENFGALKKEFGERAVSHLMRNLVDRISSGIRETDILVELTPSRFAIAFTALPRADVDTLVRICARLRDQMGEPFSLDGTSIYISACFGFCLPNRAPNQTGLSLIKSAELAAQDASAHGTGAIRAFTRALGARRKVRQDLDGEVEQALATGKIMPWFQPRMSTRTGDIIGLETTPRWHCEERGIIMPSDFMAGVITHNLTARFTQIMLTASLKALKKMRDNGVDMPFISLALPINALQDPDLPKKIEWELDRFELEPRALALDVTERFVTNAADTDQDDICSRNLSALATLGCQLDLGNFGTGNAPINSLRRFKIDRIKIDKSFITRLDRDEEQQNMVSAILTMASRLSVKTIADGVETAGELNFLEKLGCDAVQGHAIAGPMPATLVGQWTLTHSAKQSQKAAVASR